MVLRSGQYTVLDLNSELIRRLNASATPKELERLNQIKANREKQVKHNRKLGWVKRKLNANLKKEGPQLSKIEYKRRLNEIDKVAKMKKNLSILDNQANQILKKDFHYIVQDGFSDRPYRIKVSTLLKKDNPAKFLIKRFQKSLEKKLKKAESDLFVTDKQYHGIEKMLEKVANSIDTLEQAEEGEEEIQEEDIYLLTVEFLGDILDLNF